MGYQNGEKSRLMTWKLKERQEMLKNLSARITKRRTTKLQRRESRRQDGGGKRGAENSDLDAGKKHGEMGRVELKYLPLVEGGKKNFCKR